LVIFEVDNSYYGILSNFMFFVDLVSGLLLLYLGGNV